LKNPFERDDFDFLIFFGMFHLAGEVVDTFSVKRDIGIGFESWKDSKSCLTFRLKRSGEFQDFASNAPIHTVSGRNYGSKSIENPPDLGDFQHLI
jgi:hypothetical protein